MSSIIERQPWHDPTHWTFTEELESNWIQIKAEFELLKESYFHPWPELELFERNDKPGQGWNVFGLYAFGKKHFRNSNLCPKTTEIVEKIPGLSTAAFSIVEAGAKILPHVGYYGYSNMILRCHLGVDIPDGECWLRVDTERRKWKNGKCLVFDDTYIHSVKNDTNKDRVILLLDFSARELSEEEKKMIKPPKNDQRAYLDKITTMYGYGIENPEHLERRLEDLTIQNSFKTQNTISKE